MELLEKACTEDDVDNLNLLIEKGLDIRNYRYTAFSSACQNSSFKIFERLIRLGLKFSDSIFVNFVSRGNLDMTKRLIELGADVNCVSALGQRPIFIAAETGSIEMLQFLINNGVDCWVRDIRGNSLAHYACRYHMDDTFLRYFAESGVDFNCKNKVNETPLFVAVKRRNLVAVKFLLSQKVDVNICDSIGNSPLHVSIMEQRINYSIVESLIKNGADVNANNYDRQTPLHLVAPNIICLNTRFILNETVALLLDNGANVLALDRYGEPAYKGFDHELSEEFKERLIGAGADL